MAKFRPARRIFTGFDLGPLPFPPSQAGEGEGGGSIEIERGSVEFLGALDLDQHRVPLLVRVAVLFRLDEAAPDLFIDRTGPVDLRPPVKPGNAALWQHPFLAQLRLAEIHGELGSVAEVLVGRALAARPQPYMRVVVDHRAAARGDLGEPVGQHASDQAHICREGGVNVRLQDLGNSRHGSFLRWRSNNVRDPAVFEARAREARQRLDQPGDVGAQLIEGGALFQSLLVHVERAVDLDLQAVPLHRRAALPLDDLDTLVDFVDVHCVAEAAQLAGDKLGEFRLAGRAVAVAQHKIGAVPTLLAALDATLRGHRMAVDVPDDPVFAVGALAGLVEHAVVGRVAAVEPGADLGDTKLLFVDRDAGPDHPTHQAEAGSRLVRWGERRWPRPVDQRSVDIVNRSVGVEVAA